MPGHILYAECPKCRFQRKMRPGSAMVGRRGIGYAIAYSADELDLLTADDLMVKSQGLGANTVWLPSGHGGNAANTRMTGFGAAIE